MTEFEQESGVSKLSEKVFFFKVNYSFKGSGVWRRVIKTTKTKRFVILI